MRKHRFTYTALLLSTFVIGQLASGWTAPAAEAAVKAPLAAAAAGSTISSVTLAPGVSASLTDVNIWPQSGGNILTYTLRYSNNSGSSANLLHYFSRVVTPGGSVIPGNPVTADALKKKVLAKNSLSVTYYVNIGAIKSLNGIKISMNVWDAKAKGYLRQAGSFTVPANYSTAVAAGKTLSTTMNDIPVAAGGESLELYKYGGKVYAKVGLSLTNKGNKVLGDPGYSAYLISASGTSFELALNGSPTDFKIQPQEKKSIYYLTEIPAYLNTSNMRVQFTKTDETLKLELPVSSYKLPAASMPNLVVASGAAKKVIISSNAVHMRLSNASVYAEDAQAVWSLQLKVTNSGNKAVTFPTYELAVKSVSGKTFPVDAKALNGLTLKPLESKVITLKVQVPLEIEQSGLQLMMIESLSTDAGSGAGGQTEGGAGPAVTSPKLIFPVAYFSIPYTLRGNVQNGQEYPATNQYGSFSYRLQSLQRYPWKDDDIVIARLQITNTQQVTLTLPELKAALKLDNNNLAASTELMMDQEAAVLAPGKSADIAVMAKIPYTDDFDTVSLNLFSKTETESIPFLDFTAYGTLTAINNIERGGTYTITGKGKNASVQEKRTIVYEGSNSNIIYTELLMSSDEKRQSKMARLQGYFKTPDGQFYEAKPNQTDNSATPGGKQLISFWAKLPKTVSASDISLYLGSGVTGGKLSESGQEASGFINIGSLMLTPGKPAPATNLSTTVLYPYTLNVLSSEGKIVESSDTLSININYNLLRDNSFDSGEQEHKLVLRITDPYGQSQEKLLTPGTDLTEGYNNTFSMSITRDIYKKLRSGTYRLTLFDEFQGERLELSSEAYVLRYEPLPRAEDDKQ
ncbi:hypothetical protein C2I18_25550 [Paenibacillus sp. PK3_47]|uniref:hypothetical protein n=1 Tax=Paenibacillus sp. PK3_47 TaxID=2072642 RepID=UPI00201E732C|nr:hypothetical protein [Paenibacillus sp. PK3_47]UQZ36607.1 hypothetical protein C2I18_25550 [Paenibacillus sp. PK3_47]